MRYQNLDLWVERDRATGTYLIQGKSDQGDFRDTAGVSFDTIRCDREGLAAARVDAAGLVALGRALFTFLFRTKTGEKLETLLDRSLGAVTQAGEGLRIRLQLDEANPDIAALPWEYMYRPVDERFVCTSISTPLVRFLEVGVPLRPMEAKLPLAMLVVIPQAEGLNADLEVSLIEEALGPMSAVVDLQVVRGIVTAERLREELARREYDILHFVGHGAFDGDRATLRLNDERGDPAPADQATIAKVLRNRVSLKLVVLNSCQGATLSGTTAFLGMAPKLVGAGVPAVVAMQFPIRDDEALCFVRAFYGALFQGAGQGSVDYAMSAARDALDITFAGQRGFGVPALFMRYEEGLLFRVMTGRLLKDTPFSRADLERDETAIRQLSQSHERLLAETAERPADPTTREHLESQGDELARARGRVRFRNRSIGAVAVAAVVVAFASVINLFGLLPLTWVVAASPIWFRDPVGARLAVDSIAVVTIQREVRGEDRPDHARLVDRLTDAGARVVVLDMYFRTPRPADDSILAASFRRARAAGTEVVFGAIAMSGDRPEAVPALATSATVASACLGENRAEFLGIVPLVWSSADGGVVVPAMALAAVAAWKRARVVTDLDGAQVTLVDSLERVVDRVRAVEMVTVRSTYPACPMVSAGSRYGKLLAARAPTSVWRDPARHADYAAVLAAAPADLAWARGKIVLVGALTAAELSERRIGVSKDARYGVERHADAVATMLSDAEAHPLGRGWQLALIAVAAAAGGWVGYRRRWTRRLVDLAVLVGVVVVLGVVASLGYRAGVLVDVIYPSLALGLGYGVTRWAGRGR